jgi:thymidylate kinase
VVLGPEERTRVEAALASAGFVDHEDTWVRFANCTVEVVDVVPVEHWGLPPAEQKALFDESRPLDGWANLRRPAPHHALLILARRVAAGDGRLDAARRARLEEALEEDTGAWAIAQRRAPSWGATVALEVLGAFRRRGGRATPARRAAAVAERWQTSGHSRAISWSRALRTVRPQHRRGHVVAICGLDGAGKSSQAAALAEVLERLGHESLTRWTRISQNPSLPLVAAPVVRLLSLARPDPVAPPPVPADLDPSRLATSSQRLRQRSRILTAGWATVVAVTNGLAQRRATSPHLRRGRLVVCDRWTLDSAVHLRYRYGESRRFGFQVALIRLISPRPLSTVFLDIPAKTAYARKDDHYDVGQLRRQQRLYEEEHRRAGARRLDGERSRDELCADIARLVTAELHGRRRGLLPRRPGHLRR